MLAAVVAVIDVSLLREEAGRFVLRLEKLGRLGCAFNLCSDQWFLDQWLAASGTGFLIKRKYLVAAADTVTEENLEDIRFVRGFKLSSAGSIDTTFSPSEVLRGVAIHASHLGCVLVELSADVMDADPLPVRIDGGISRGFYMMGYPRGLPIKYADDAVLLGVSDSYFSATLDAFMGNSGSPVFGVESQEVEGGVLFWGPTVFQWYPTYGCNRVFLATMGEDVVRSSVWADWTNLR